MYYGEIEVHFSSGRAESGWALAPEPPRATWVGPEFPLFFLGSSTFCEIGRLPHHFCEPFSTLFFPAFLRSDFSLFWDRTSIRKFWVRTFWVRSPTRISKREDVRSQKCFDVRCQIGETPDLKNGENGARAMQKGGMWSPLGRSGLGKNHEQINVWSQKQEKNWCPISEKCEKIDVRSHLKWKQIVSDLTKHGKN